MVKLTQSLSQWLWDHHRDKIALIMLGHTELLTDEMWDEYIEMKNRTFCAVEWSAK